ncbi:MAG TPA: YciI family protein [Thermomicrobiales bacterium]|nr:YciI family protein [Thermomicrobiales bacterium]
MTLYAALFTYVADPARIDEVRPAHREYLKQLLDEGTLHEAGRFGDERGGLIVYNTESESDARTLLDRDPFSTSGIISIDSVQEWKVILSACT